MTYSASAHSASPLSFLSPGIFRSARLWLIAGIAVASTALSTLAVAQEDPSSRVGRVSRVEGQVWLNESTSNEQVTGVVNWPVTTGTSLETGLTSRAEVRVGSSTVRLAPSTKAQFIELSDRTLRLNVEHGSVALRFKDSDRARESWVVTQAGVINFSEAGRYRVDADYDRTTFAVSQGQAQMNTQANTFGLRTGGRMEVASNGNTRNTERYADSFDDWVSDLDRRDDSRPAPRYVSREMTGYDTLEDGGNWNDVSGYGAVWYPRVVVADWAPYRYGRWTNLQPWGWTWVDDAPWGFAVSHYGRWGWIGGRWGWVPGAIVSRPVWAPALVAWGGGSGWNWSVSVGSPVSYGWVPLAPAEVYVPWYRCTERYNRGMNITHVSNVTVINNYYQNPGSQAFANAQVPGAVSAAAAGAAFAGRTFPGGSSTAGIARGVAAAQQAAAVQLPMRQQIRAVTDIKFAAAAFDQHRIVAPVAPVANGQAAPAPTPIRVTPPAVPMIAGNPAANAAAAAARGAQAPQQANPAAIAPPANMQQSGRPLNPAQANNTNNNTPREVRATQDTARAAAIQQQQQRSFRGEPQPNNVPQQALPPTQNPQAPQGRQEPRAVPRELQRDPREAPNSQAAQQAAQATARAAQPAQAAPPAPREVRQQPQESRTPAEAARREAQQQQRDREGNLRGEREDNPGRRQQER